jgi:hypothetical protein
MSYATSPYDTESHHLGSANHLLGASSVDAKSDGNASFSRIKMENDDSLELDEEEDSHDDDSDKDKDPKLDSKVADGKPPYSYVAMIGKDLFKYSI